MRTRFSTNSTKLILVAAIGLWVSAFTAPAWAGNPSDSWITMKTKIALVTADGVDANDINVDTVRGRVTLHGKVSSEEEKDKAERVAHKIDGVKKVLNLLQVVKSERDRDRVEETDEVIEERIDDRFKNTPMLSDSDISVVSVNKGVVLLGGEAETLHELHQALKVARSVDGVRKVASQVKSSDKIGDEAMWRAAQRDEIQNAKSPVSAAANSMWITTAVKMRLIASPDVPAMEVNVDTNDGVVTLFGIVDSNAAKAAAEAEAKKVDEVVEVRNELQVVPEEKRESVDARDEDLDKNVKMALKEERALDTASIDVEVKNRIVRLTGKVDSYTDRLAAGFVARSVRGVRSVQNDLLIEEEKLGD